MAKFNIVCANVMGLGIHSRSKNKMKGVPTKIRELVSSAKYIPSLYICLETKLDADHKQLKLPPNMDYVGETCSPKPKAGIFMFCDKSISFDKTNIQVISSAHAMYAKVISKGSEFEIITVYLPCDTESTIQILRKIDNFLLKRNITNFTLIGDMNISFSRPEHRTKARALLNFVDKYNLFDVAKKLNMQTDCTWRGRGERSTSMSVIDYCFSNNTNLNHLSFKYNSFSDHKTLTVGVQKKYVYNPPSWQKHLFKIPDFIELMKKETATFLFDNADESTRKEFEFYSENKENVDIDFSFNKPEYKDLSVLFALLKHLKIHHDKFFSKLKFNSFNKTQDFDKEISKLYADLDKYKNLKKIDEIKILISQQQEFFRNLSFIRAETAFLRGLILDGNNNSYTFSHCRRKTKNEHNLIIDNVLTNDPLTIVKHLSKMHADIVAPSNVPISSLDTLLTEFDISLDEMYPKITTLSSPLCTTKEYRDVIKSMSNNSCPGISTEPKILYEFLFNFVPNFSTRAFNHIHCIDIDKSPFSSIKDRNIVFINKKGSDPKLAKNLRGICMMETMYKISSKSLNCKVKPYLDQIVHPDQHGFIPGRHMHTASVSMTATMNYIKKHEINAQLVSFDIQRAFDRVLPEVLHRILKHIFPSGNFADSWINLISKGRFRAIANNCVSEFIDIILGTPQGGPSAATLYDIVHHIFLSCLDSKLFKAISLHVNSKIIPAAAFADDSWKFYCFKNNTDVEKVFTLLSKLEETTGLKVNFTKTKILTNGIEPANLDIIGKVQPYFKHLGIIISFDMAQGAKLTYDELIQKLDRKAKQYPLFSNYSIIKRRNLCMSLLNSMCFHIFRVYSPNSTQTKKLWKVMSKFLWSSKSNEGISYRYKVASKQIELNLWQGGLKILKPESQSISIFMPSLLHLLNHARLYPSSSLGILLKFYKVDINFLLNNFGVKSLQKNRKFLKLLYPGSTKIYFDKTVQFLKNLELNKNTMLKTLIASSFWAKRFTKNQIQILADNSLVTLFDLLEHRIIGDRIMLLPTIRSDIHTLIQDSRLVKKLQSYVEVISSKQNILCLDTIDQKKLSKIRLPLINVNDFKPSILSLHFKWLQREKYDQHAPSIKTRKRDGLYFPDIESFENSFKKVMSLPLILHYKSFLVEQLNRTLVSRKKLMHFGLLDNAICPKCNAESTTEHGIFYCYFAKYFIHALALFLDQKYNDGNPEFIFLKENFFLFNIIYPQFNDKDFLQISTIILVAKDRALKSSKDEAIKKWTVNNCYSQTLFVAQFAIKILEKTSSYINIASEFLNFLLQYKDNITYFQT